MNNPFNWPRIEHSPTKPEPMKWGRRVVVGDGLALGRDAPATTNPDPLGIHQNPRKARAKSTFVVRMKHGQENAIAKARKCEKRETITTEGQD